MIKHRAQDKNERGLSVMGKLKLDFYYGREAEQFTFYRLPKALITDACFKGMRNNTKLLYGLMLDRMSLSKKREWLDEANKVCIKYSLNNIEEDLNVSRKTASSLLKELEEIGLIDMIQQIPIDCKKITLVPREKFHPSNIEIDNNSINHISQ